MLLSTFEDHILQLDIQECFGEIYLEHKAS